MEYFSQKVLSTFMSMVARFMERRPITVITWVCRVALKRNETRDLRSFCFARTISQALPSKVSQNILKVSSRILEASIWGFGIFYAVTRPYFSPNRLKLNAQYFKYNNFFLKMFTKIFWKHYCGTRPSHF